ncbi:MAG: efflux RND transporter periplasmic adaptor subunit [Eubacteriales bacterium]|nr:efflux RND transporter periplasmic adaptor subunit [Eubacteriales bacterium]
MSEEKNKENEAVQTTEGNGKKSRKKRAKAAGTKKKIKKKYVVLGVIIVLILLIFIFSKVTAGSSVMPVTCATAYTGDVEENISASGKVGSTKSQTYFAPVGAKVAQVNVQLGDEVKAGDLLLAFDTQDLELQKTKADLEASQAVNSYQSAMQESNENQNEYSSATIGLEELKEMKANQEQYVQGLKYELEDATAAKREALYDWDKQLQQELTYQNRKLAEARPGSKEEENIEEVIDNVNSQHTDVQNQLSMLENDEELKQKQRVIDAEEKKLNDMTEEISRRESKQSSSEGGILNGYAKQEKEISVESANLAAKQASEDLAAAVAGITAEFDGVVTEVSVVGGATVAEGAQLFTVESTQDVKVTVELTKYDLDKVKVGQEADVTIAGFSYQGKVDKINRMAQNNEQNTLVINADIVVENPDGNIFLGVEGKTNIHTAESEGTVLVPYEAVNTDKDGDFCYVVKDGIVAKQRVVTGISNDTDVEVTEGISEGDIVVTASGLNIEEGMQVMPVIQ